MPVFGVGWFDWLHLVLLHCLPLCYLSDTPRHNWRFCWTSTFDDSLKVTFECWYLSKCIRILQHNMAQYGSLFRQLITYTGDTETNQLEAIFAEKITYGIWPEGKIPFIACRIGTKRYNFILGPTSSALSTRRFSFDRLPLFSGPWRIWRSVDGIHFPSHILSW